MTRSLARLAVLAAIALAPPASAQPVSEREVILIPVPEAGTAMRTTVYRPSGHRRFGRGPFGLVIINHASLQNAVRRAALPAPDFADAVGWFLARGYVVALPQRPGHGETGGTYLEDQDGCDSADYRRAGLGAAVSIEAALRYMVAQPYVRRDRIIVVGHSAGGWGAVALGSRNPHGVKAVISFAGGRGGRSFDQPNRNCAPERLVAAAGEFGRTSRVPAMWIYAQNDSHFGLELAARMAKAYREAGGRLEFRALPRFGTEGHALFEAREGVAVWGPIVERFLANLK